MKVFLSYARADADFAQRLASSMSSAGVDVFPGDDWPSEPNAALATADAIVVLLSRSALDSPYVMKELEYGLVASRVERRLIPVLLENSLKYPWILRTLKPVRANRSASQTAEVVLHRLRSSKSK